MQKRIMKKYLKNKKEMVFLERIITDLYEDLSNTKVVSGKVRSTSKQFPYIEQHVTVEMNDPVEADRIKSKIRAKEEKLKELQDECNQVETYIENMEEGMLKEICEAVYLKGESQESMAKKIGYTQARISQILKDL